VRKVPEWLRIYALVLVALAVLLLIGFWLVDNGMEGGSLAEWFAAVGTIGAVGVAVVMTYSDRDHHRRRESFVEASMVILDVEMGAQNLTQAVGALYGDRTVAGIVLPSGPAPIRNVRARMTWSSGTVDVDGRGVADGPAGEYQARHLVPDTAARWPFTVKWGPEDPRPQLESWTVTWVDRWDQWWSSTLGESKPLRIEPLDPVSPEWPQRI
jgi:hypothetical protein